MSKKILSIGYPIGYSLIGSEEFYNIQLNNKMYPLNLIGTYIWINALELSEPDISKKETIASLEAKGYRLNKDYKTKDVEEIYQILIDNNLIVEIDTDDLENTFECLKNSKTYRQGFGIGIENNQISILFNNKKENLTPLQYFIWQLSTGTNNLSNIYTFVVENIKNTTNYNMEINDISDVKKIIIQDIINLYTKGLINITSI